MAASTTGQTRDTKTRFKVNHARQVVDQVTLLRERVKRQEKALEIVIHERDRAMEVCDKQKILIAQLLEKINNLSPERDSAKHCSNATRSNTTSALANKQERDFDNLNHLLSTGAETTEDPEDARGAQFGRPEPGKTAIRVNSMRAALLRIGGIDISHSSEQHHTVDEDTFDASEFQPIADDEHVLARVKDGIASSLARVSPFRRNMSVMESDGLQT